MDCFLCQQRTVYLNRRQSVKCFHDCFIGNSHGLPDCLSLYQLRGHAAGCHGSPAAKGFELHVTDNLILINIQVNPHDIAAFGISHCPHSAGVLYLTHISGVLKMVHYFFCVHLYSS